MELQSHTLNDLFDQLGLDSTDADIDRFIDANQLPADVKLVDAQAWTERQRNFLKEEYREDAQWVTVIDELNTRLHPQGATH